MSRVKIKNTTNSIKKPKKGISWQNNVFDQFFIKIIIIATTSTMNAHRIETLIFNVPNHRSHNSATLRW